MTAETTPAPFETGTLLRVTETHDVDGTSIGKGEEFTVSDFWPGGDPDEGFIPFPFYCGDANGGSNNRQAAADKVELVKTAEQMAARRVPTPEAIIAELTCLGDYDGFRTDEADRPAGASREISGITDDGLPFAFTITVSNVYEADL